MFGNSDRTYRDSTPFIVNKIPVTTENQYGGALRVYAYEKRKNEEFGKHRPIFGKMRNQGNQWHTQTIIYSAESSVQVRYLFIL